MNRWMVILSFKETPTPEVLALIPAEQARVKELKEQNLMEAIYISNAKVWLVLHGETQQAVQETLATLPMHSYFAIELVLLNS